MKIPKLILGLNLALFCTLAGSVVSAQEADQKAIATDADSAYQAKEWARSTKLYEELTKQQPANGRFWYRLGVSLHGNGKNEEALAAFQKASESGVPPSYTEYAKATVYVSMNRNEEAFAALDRLVQSGFSGVDQLAKDEDFVSMQSDPKFAKVLAQAKHNQKPCADTPENRQFDFWIGEWNVVTTKGDMPAGDSKIELILGDCVVQENWTSGGNIGYAGKSYNVYDANLKRWEQFWADNAAGMIHFYGGLKDGVMDYWTDEIPQPDGTKAKRHMQFIPHGADKVQQFSQRSNDGGKTWTPEYDFTYNRKK